MKNELLQANWIHPPKIERWLESMTIGKTLNVCCGMSRVGDVRVDISSESTMNVKADVHALPFRKLSFDTVICDPPFSYYGRYRWVLRLSELARKRFLISTSTFPVHLKKSVWDTSLWYDNGQGRFMRLYFCFDRRMMPLDS